MSIAHSTALTGYLKPPRVQPLVVLFALAFALTGAVPLVYLADTSNKKVIGAVVGGAVVLIAGLIAGNVRLACLWALVITMTLDLSKHFGTLYEKMGGESSFKIEASDPFIVALAFYIGRDIWKNRRDCVQIPRVTFLWSSIILWSLLNALSSEFRLTAGHELFRMCKVLTLFLVLTNELTGVKKILQCAAALNFAMIAQSAVGLVQYGLHRNLGLSILGEAAAGTMRQLAEQSIEGDRAFRPGALMSHPNIFGVFLAVVLPISIASYMLKTGKFRKPYFLAGAGIGMAALILTLSRSGWLAFSAAFFTLIVCLLLHHGLRRRGMLAGILATVALLSICVVFSTQIAARVFNSKPGAMISRAEYVRTARALIQDHYWTGSGLNSYVFAAPRYSKYGVRGALAFYKNWYPPVHNIYYLWWSEIGLIGLILHLCFWGLVISIAVRNLAVRDETLFAIAAGCLGGLIAFVSDGFFSFTFRINSIERTYFVVASMVFAIHYLRLREQRMQTRPEQGELVRRLLTSPQ